MFSSVSAPFCWPITAILRPSSVASPATIAASSPKKRSPWSSMKSSVIASTNSRVRGRWRLRASDDAVDEPVREQELGSLEPVGQLLRDRAGRDPRASETDEGVGLGHVDIADGGKRCEDPARSRVREDADERHAGLAQALE